MFNRNANPLLPSALCATLLFVGLHVSAGDANAQYKASASYMSILTGPNYGSYNGMNYLLYSSKSAQLPNAKPQGVAIPLALGTQVGISDPNLPPGQCVSFARPVTGAPNTGSEGQNWFRGTQVVGSNTSPGTLIATFVWSAKYGRYVYGGHTAIFAGFKADGSLLVWDQNWQGPYVTFHAISGNGNGGVTDRKSYFVVK